MYICLGEEAWRKLRGIATSAGPEVAMFPRNCVLCVVLSREIDQFGDVDGEGEIFRLQHRIVCAESWGACVFD